MERRSEYERDKQIDPDQLDVECVRQADTFFKWAEKSVDAKDAADRMKLRLDTVEAELELQVRKRPGRFDLEKPTESAIKAVVKTHRKYLAAYEAYFEARKDSALLDKAVAAMDMKKKMLDNLIELHGQAYFAGPRVPRNLHQVWKRHQEESEKRLNERQIRAVKKRREG